MKGVPLLPVLGSVLLLAATVECTPDCHTTSTCPCRRDENCQFEGAGDCNRYFCIEGNCAVVVVPEGASCNENAGYCDGAGQCLTGFNIGQPCSDNNHCISGHCVSGMCCFTPCDGVCDSCVEEGSVGECTSVAPGTDPLDHCEGAGVCGGSFDGCVSGQASAAYVYPFGSPYQGSVFTLAVDDVGNIIMAGGFAKELILPMGVISSPSDNDGFVLPVADTPGPYQRYSDVAAAVTGLTMLQDGGYAVAGWYAGELELGGVKTLNDGSVEGFMAYYQSDGVFDGGRTITGVLADPDCPPQVATGGYGDQVVMFRFSGSFDWAGQQQTSGGGNALFVGRVAKDGSEIAATHVFPIDGPARCRLAPGPAPEIVIAGAFDGSIEFTSSTIVSSGGGDGWLLRIDTANQQEVVQTYNSLMPAEVSDVVRHVSGEVIITGGFADQLNIAGTQLTSGDGSATFVAKLDPQGQLIWAKVFGDYVPGVTAVALDSKGNVIHSGMFVNTIDLGTGTRDGGNAYFVKYTSNGTHLYHHIFDGDANNRIDHLTIGLYDNIILSGVFSQTLSLGDDTLSGGQRAIGVIIREP